MTTTLVLVPTVLFLVASVVVAVDWLERRARERDRRIVRRIQRYLDQLPPTRPWS